jgi:hypothetical protein
MDTFRKHTCGGDTAWLPQQANCARQNVGYAPYCQYNKRGKWRIKILPLQFQTTAKRQSIRMERNEPVHIQSPCMCCHLPTLRCTTLHNCTPERSATPPRARALAPNSRTSPHAPVNRKGTKYTLPLPPPQNAVPSQHMHTIVVHPFAGLQRRPINDTTTYNSKLPSSPAAVPPTSTNHERSIRSLLGAACRPAGRPTDCTALHLPSMHDTAPHLHAK